MATDHTEKYLAARHWSATSKNASCETSHQARVPGKDRIDSMDMDSESQTVTFLAEKHLEAVGCLHR
jgi:hypothetical protein